MALSALGTKATYMDVVLLVTVDTAAAGLLVGLVEMTAVTQQVGVQT
jgi:hypothetical protein